MMGSYRASLLAMLVIVGIAGCTSLPPQAVPSDLDQARQQHARRVAGIDTWTLNGRISLRRDDEAWHASLFWQQVQDIFQIRIIAPLGQGGAQLDGGPHNVVLQTGDGEFRADSAERLLAEQFGWQLPVEGLRYWALGLAAPGTVGSASYDEFGQLAELQQAGWEIEYRGYIPAGAAAEGLLLPGKIFLRRDGIEVRLVVDSWSTTRTAVAGS